MRSKKMLFNLNDLKKEQISTEKMLGEPILVIPKIDVVHALEFKDKLKKCNMAKYRKEREVADTQIKRNLK